MVGEEESTVGYALNGILEPFKFQPISIGSERMAPDYRRRQAGNSKGGNLGTRIVAEQPFVYKMAPDEKVIDATRTRTAESLTQIERYGT